MHVSQRIGGSLIAVLAFGFAGTQFLQVVWLSKAYGADSLGLVSIVLGLFSPFLSFLTAGQRFSILTSGGSGNKEKSVQIFIRVSLILLLLLFFLLSSKLNLTGWGVSVDLVLAIGVHKFFDSILELDSWFRQKKSDLKGFVLTGSFRLLPIPFATIVSLFFELSLDVYLLTIAALSFLSVVFVCRSHVSFFTLSFFEKKYFRDVGIAAKAIFPVGVAAGFESLTVTMPRYFLASVGSLSDVALFVFFTQIAMVFGMIASARLQANMGSYAKLSNENPSHLIPVMVRSILVLIAVIVGVSIPFFFVPSNLFALVVGDWIVQYRFLLVWIPLFSCVWYIGGYANNVSAIVNGRWTLIVSSLVLALTLLLCLLVGYFLRIDSLWVALGALTCGFVVRSAHAFYGLRFSKRIC